MPPIWFYFVIVAEFLWFFIETKFLTIRLGGDASKKGAETKAAPCAAPPQAAPCVAPQAVEPTPPQAQTPPPAAACPAPPQSETQPKA